jgi:hypothetical protein
MAISWSELIFTPDDDAIVELASAWGWRLKEPFRPVLFSALGDMFFARDAGDVWWLNTGSGELTRVAASVEEFQRLLGTSIADEWLLPPLVEQLRTAGKLLQPGECYTFVTLPVFAEGNYEVDNLNPVRAREHFALTGGIHQDLQAYPDGSKVKLTVVK